MKGLAGWLEQRFSAGEGCIYVQILEVFGSTPRNTDALMLVSLNATAGTIGGGQLEFHAIDIAREMLHAGEQTRELDLALGPHMGQCCGGRVKLKLAVADGEFLEKLKRNEEEYAARRSNILTFGAGHTGKALCSQLLPLPFKVTLIDDRSDVFGDISPEIAVKQLSSPAELVGECPPNSAYIILTHSHSLDYAICAAALKRNDAAYVGMIGSTTKRARFASWFLQSGGSAAGLERLVCPIGGAEVVDKRPEIIAALTIAELIRVFAKR